MHKPIGGQNGLRVQSPRTSPVGIARQQVSGATGVRSSVCEAKNLASPTSRSASKKIGVFERVAAASSLLTAFRRRVRAWGVEDNRGEEGGGIWVEVMQAPFFYQSSNKIVFVA